MRLARAHALVPGRVPRCTCGARGRGRGSRTRPAWGGSVGWGRTAGRLPSVPTRLQPLHSPRSLQSAAAVRLTVTRAARVCFFFCSLRHACSNANPARCLRPRLPVCPASTQHLFVHSLPGPPTPAPRRLLLAPPRAPARYLPLLAWGVLCAHARGGGTARRLPARVRSGVSRESSGETAEPAGSRAGLRTGPLGTAEPAWAAPP